MIGAWIGELAHALFGWTKLSSTLEVLLLFNAVFWACLGGLMLLRHGFKR